VVEDVAVSATVLDLDGSVSETLAEQASAEGADLVVMTTHGRGGFTRFLLGSVADDLVRVSPMPVLLVRPQDEEPKLDAFPEMKDVVVGVDGTKLSERMLELAAGFADVTGSQLTLARVVTPVEISQGAETDPGIEQEAKHLMDQTNQCQERLLKTVETYLEGLAKPLRARGLEVQTRVVVESDPHSALLKLSHATDSGLIALETHGRSGISRWVLGSVADKVIRDADVPVLVHRPLVA
jgi:nucleotide-binding universal stress UspA family protein